MSKRQAVSVAEIAELEALGIVAETPAEPKEEPIIAHANGYKTQTKTCPNCGNWYVRTWVPGFDFPIGECKPCAELQREADAYMARPETQEEIRRKLAEGLAQSEREIMADADCLLEKHLAEYKPDALAFYQNEVHSQYAQQIRASVESEMRSEYLKQAQEQKQ